jgi:hypothetical protein
MDGLDGDLCYWHRKQAGLDMEVAAPRAKFDSDEWMDDEWMADREERLHGTSGRFTSAAWGD